MNKVDEYILNAIKTHVWGGFDTPDDVQEMISDLLEEGANEEMLRNSVELEFKKNVKRNYLGPPLQITIDSMLFLRY